MIPNVKFPGDICIEWDGFPDRVFSYDEDYLDETCERADV